MMRGLSVRNVGLLWRITFALIASVLTRDSLTTRPAARVHSDVYNRLPLSFEANRGQAGGAVQFLSRGPGYSLFLKPAEAELLLFPTHRQEKPAVLRMQFRGANTQASSRGEEVLPGKSNYFLGSDPAQWRTNIPTYAKVRYDEVYPGIDLIYYGDGRQLEYDLVVAPGADPDAIRLGFEESATLAIDDDGDLVLRSETGDREARLHKPLVYQHVMGRRLEVSAEYVLLNPHEAAFRLGGYDQNKSLVIDPVLSYATYLGGSSVDRASGIAVDASGNIYVTGSTSSTDFPAANAIQPVIGSGWEDAFVAKLNPSGSALLFSTYFGGNSVDEASGIAVDSAGNAHLTGYTWSTNFPLAAAVQPSLGGRKDAFYVKLNSAGSALLQSTYLGGADEESGSGVAVDGAGNAYITGWTVSTDFPTANPLQPALRGPSDVFVSKLNATGYLLLYSTYLGGFSNEEGSSVAVNSSGSLYVAGSTTSSDFPTANAMQPILGGVKDAFVARFNPAGSSLLYSTYFGGSSDDGATGIATVGATGPVVTGWTLSPDFPTANAFQPVNGGQDAFLAKFNAAGSGLVYSTFLGGSTSDRAAGVAVDDSQNAYVIGETFSNDFPLVNPFHPAPPSPGTYNAFVAKFTAAGFPIYSSYFNGTGVAYAIAADRWGTAYVAGGTANANLPTVNPLQPFYAGGGLDGFLGKITSGVPPTLTSINPQSGAAGTMTNVLLTGANFATGSTAVLISGSGVTAGNIQAASPGRLTATFFITASAERGTRNVTVTTPDGTSNAVAFTVRRP